MKEFPTRLIPANRPQFNEYLFNRDVSRLRAEVYEHMLHNSNTSYDLKVGGQGYNYQVVDAKIVAKIMEELHILGWKTSLVYGGTALYIWGENEPEPKGLQDMEEFE